MGVSTNWYSIYGLRIEWDDALAEQYDEVYDNKDTPFILMDCYSSEYMILGSLLFDSGDYRWGFDGGDTYKEYITENLLEKEKEYKEQFIAKFPNLKHLVESNFKLISMVHYS